MEVEKIGSCLLFTVMFLFSLVSVVKAAPIIENAALQPENPWIGEDAVISLNCTDDNNSIDYVYAAIEGPDIMLPLMNFTGSDNTYTLAISSDYLYKTGQYNVYIVCVNNVSENATQPLSFMVSQLNGYFYSVTEPAYIDGMLDIYFILKKDGVHITSGVTFELRLDGQPVSFSPPPYESGRGYYIKIDSPDNEGAYALEVKASYQGGSVSNTTVLHVLKPIEFELVELNRFLNRNGNINLVFRINDRGIPVTSIKQDDLEFKLNGADLDIDSFSKNGNTYTVTIISPDMEPGSYDFEIKVSYKGQTFKKTEKVSYTIPISGRLAHNEEGVNADIIFEGDNGLKITVSTNDDGFYTGYIGPGEYDVRLSSPKTELVLYNVNITEFDDPIKYYRLGNVNIQGLKTSSVFVYETVLDYSKAYIEMKYNDRDVPGPEDQLKVYKCKNWNSGTETCYSNWSAVDSVVDIIRNFIKLNTTSLSAYALGIERVIKVESGLDKDTFFLSEGMVLKGIATDEDNNPIAGVEINAEIVGTGKKYNATTSDQGLFEIDMKSPDSEGRYTVLIKAEKKPYVGFSGSLHFDVKKKIDITVSAPDSVRIISSSNATVNFSVVNTGQVDLEDITLSIAGIPVDLFNLTEESIDVLKVNEQRKIPVYFEIPGNMDPESYTSEFRAFSDDIDEKETFLLTIIGEGSSTGDYNQTATDNVSSPTANIIAQLFEGMQNDIVYILIISVVCISTAYFLRRKKIDRSGGRKWVKNLLSGINHEIDKSSGKLKSPKTKKESKRKYRKR